LNSNFFAQFIGQAVSGKVQVLHEGSVERLLRPSDGDEEAAADQRILLGFPLPGFPPFLVRAGQKVLPHFALKPPSKKQSTNQVLI
jgi:hypothetical protein